MNYRMKLRMGRPSHAAPGMPGMRAQRPGGPSHYARISSSWKRQVGKMGYILLWALGVPIPILFIIYLLRGCS
jgi:hypothetical protein